MIRHSLALSAVLALVVGCEGPKGSKGPAGPEGPPGPAGEPVAAPVINSINPGIASAAMEVRITGQNFSTTPAENRVFFGGVEATVDAATATEITTHPVNGGFSGEIDVTVVVNGLTSNSVKFRLGFSGEAVPVAIHEQFAAADVARLADGTVIFADDSTSSLFRISSEGVVSRAVTYVNGQQLLETPYRLVTMPNGSLLVIDRDWILWEFRPATDELVLVRVNNNYGWLAGAYQGNDLYLLQEDGSTLDKVTAGVLTEGWADLSAACSGGADDIAVVGTRIYAPTDIGEICSVDVADPLTVDSFTIAGDAPSAFYSVAANGAGLVATGDYPTDHGIGTIALDVATTTATVTEETATSPSFLRGIVPGAAGTYIVATDSAEVYSTDATDWTLKAAPVASSFDMVENGGKLYVTTVPNFSAIAELNGDGTYRIVANDTALDGFLWLDLDADGAASLLVGIYNGGVIERVTIANGARAMALDHSGVGTVAGFTRDAAGNFLVASYLSSSDVAKYDAQGALVDAAFITGGAAPFHITRVGTNLYFTDVNGNAVWQVPVTGGAATALVAPGTATATYTGIVADRDGNLLVADVTGTIYRVTAAGYLTPWTFASTPFGIATAADGRVLVGDVGDVPYTLLP